MRLWYSCLNTLMTASQYNPPGFIELIMLALGLLMLVISVFLPDKPYLILSLSLMIGAASSILVREAVVPSPNRRLTRTTAIILLLVSLYGFVDLITTL